jgi:hypothetical protein
MKEDNMTSVRFVSKISKMGDKRLIIIPKDYHDEIEKLKPKQVMITIDDKL